jgi:perosamine synthetase
MRALRIGNGDEVVTTPFSFIASANCIVYERAVPRFIDIEEETLGLDPVQVADVHDPSVRAVIPVHIFGRPCLIDEIENLARSRNWKLIEDSCEALGSRRGGRPLGSYGEASVFAFYPNKQITTGEGGIVVTDDDEMAETLRSLRNQGRDADGTWLRHIQLGYNYRLDEMSAALGVAQLERLAELRAGRDAAVAAYARHLAGLADRELLRLPSSGPADDVDWFVYVVRLAPGIDREGVIRSLAEQGVDSRPYFSPLHLQPVYREYGYRPGDFPVTERVAASSLALPFSSLLSEDEVAYVAQALRAAVKG